MISKFELDEEEQQSAKLFESDHKHIGTNKGAIGGHIYYRFIPTSIGTAVSIGCSICNEEKNITNYNW